ncbi:hypothetical protein GE09DRAFT_331126 [Coniochaeta sp. 2T2.1]|nr:hypothetical protein GE09DRAFT_331126 [Coniochaeta sp. 2T2.1]
MRSTLLLAATALLQLVSSHNLISNAVGDAGGKGIAFGVSSPTSNSQSDTTTFRGSNNKFGSTQKGAINPAAQLAAAQQIAGSNTLPQVEGQITLTLHQINADGAGPMSCSIDTAAAGTFEGTTVATDVPGKNGRSNAADQDFPLVVDVPAGTVCTGTLGTVKNVCLVKCQNPAGPFGGVVAFQMASGAAGAAGAAVAAGGAKGGNAANANGSGKKQGRWVAVEW